MKDLIPLVVALTLIAGLAALVLAMVFSITEEPMRLADLNKVWESIITVLPEDAVISDEERKSDPAWVNSGDFQYYLGKNENGDVVGVAYIAVSQEGYGGELKTMVGLKPDGTIIRIFNVAHKETPGLGSKIKEPGFKDQFKDANLSNRTLEVEKDNKGTTERPPIDAITGATISSRAVTNSVRLGLENFVNNLDKILSTENPAESEGGVE